MTSAATAPDICRLAEADAATLRQIWQETKIDKFTVVFKRDLPALAILTDANILGSPAT